MRTGRALAGTGQMSSLVSVVIPTHNRPALLRRAVHSVLCQSYDNIEVLVVDDSPQLSASSVCQEFRDRRITYCRNLKSKGACGSRNTGIYLARGVFYTGLDDDDYFHSDRIRILKNYYEKDYSFVTANTLELRPEGPCPRFRGKLLINLKDILWSNCVGNQIFTETSKVREIGGFDESLVARQDRDLWIRMIERWGNALRIAPCLYNLDINHDGPRITTTSDNMLRGLRDFLTIHGAKLTLAQRMVIKTRIKKCSRRSYLLTGLVSLCFLGSWEYLYKLAKRIW